MLIKVEYPERRLLDKEEAADYCRIPRTKFCAVCPVTPVKLHDSLKPAYDKQDLDRWIDTMKDGVSDFSEDKILERLD